MSKKQNKNDTAQENQELEKARREFGPKKKIMEEEMLNGLIQYVRDGIFPKSKPGSYMTCYNIIYEFKNFNEKDGKQYLIKILFMNLQIDK